MNNSYVRGIAPQAQSRASEAGIIPIPSSREMGNALEDTQQLGEQSTHSERFFIETAKRNARQDLGGKIAPENRCGSITTQAIRGRIRGGFRVCEIAGTGERDFHILITFTRKGFAAFKRMTFAGGLTPKGAHPSFGFHEVLKRAVNARTRGMKVNAPQLR